ncbi:gap junction beta-5 protein-like [Rhineura floridana]|uniref:gap junction beta-5 protein-like n=1 Tax=Rhineura floridana TaxID=261503 RepID=UPI002AC84657|nr:gap junction beta-5 protein-like [Rhineura floridana]
MESEALMTLLSGTSRQVHRLCRAGLSFLTVLRLGSLALGAKTLWRDEMADLQCNSTSQGCILSCFDKAFPISPFNLFLLQAASLLTHGVACACIFHSPRCQGKSGWWRGPLHGKSHGLRLHWVSLLAKALLEGIFLMAFHGLYSRYPSGLRCPLSVTCPKAVLCAIQYANWKDTFNLFVAGMTWVSVALCLVALYPAIAETLRPPSSPLKNQLARPFLVSHP